MALPGLAGPGWAGWNASHIKNPKWMGKTLIPGMTYGGVNIKGDPGSLPVAAMGAPAAPPPVVVAPPPTRATLVQALTPGRGGGYDLGSGIGGNPTISGPPGMTAALGGYNNAGGGPTGLPGGSNNPANSWGRTTTGVRSSARNPNGSWGNSVSNSGTGWGGWGGLFGGGSSRGGGWGSASEGGMGGRNSFF